MGKKNARYSEVTVYPTGEEDIEIIQTQYGNKEVTIIIQPEDVNTLIHDLQDACEMIKTYRQSQAEGSTTVKNSKTPDQDLPPAPNSVKQNWEDDSIIVPDL